MRLCRSALAAWLLSIAPTILLAQGGRATILGAVSDETGAAVPRVSITILNTGTQLKRTVLTDERGDFEAPALDIGAYVVTAQAPGFRQAVVQNIRLEVDQKARVDIKLQIGEITQQVQVAPDSGSPPWDRRFTTTRSSWTALHSRPPCMA